MASARRTTRCARERTGDNAGICAGKTRGEYLNEQRRRDTLVAARRGHCACERSRRVCRWTPIAVEGPTFGDPRAGARALHNFALGDNACALIDHETRAARTSRHCERPGIGANRGLLRTPRCNRGRRIGEAKRDKTAAGDAFRVIAKHAAIVGIADREARYAVCLGGFREHGKTKVDRRMRKSALRVNDEARGRRARQDGFGRADDLAARQVFAIGRKVHQAVGFDPIALGRSDAGRECRSLRVRSAVPAQRGSRRRLDLSEWKSEHTHTICLLLGRAMSELTFAPPRALTAEKQPIRSL